ncbi:MAG: aminotransferase class IV [SAR86 cluster bacterium]|nr:aminotransferase class IV [SAR86 cluster bacterium]
MTFAFFNDGFFPIEEIKISPFDRGFLFGDAVYEVIPVYKKKLFLIDEHLSRLVRSLEETKIPKPQKWDQLKEIFTELIYLNQFSNQSIYLQISRGVEIKRSHIPSKKLEPTLFITSSSLPPNPYRKNKDRRGIKASLLEDKRWKRCDIKSVNLLPNVLALNKAHSSGFEDVIFYEGDEVTEGASSNIFLLFGKEVISPPQSNKILSGITRNYIISLLERLGLNFTEKIVKKDDLFEADEVWLTSSTREVQPVSEIDGKELTLSDPINSYWRKILEVFNNQNQTIS